MFVRLKVVLALVLLGACSSGNESSGEPQGEMDAGMAGGDSGMAGQAADPPDSGSGQGATDAATDGQPDSGAEDAATAVEDAGATDAGGTDAGSPDAGGADAGGPGFDDTALFVPDIPNPYEGSLTDPMLEVVAHTIVETADGPVWMAAVENTGTDTLCTLTMPTNFLDSDGVMLARSTLGSVRSPLYRTNNGQGSLTECLGPGDIGMVVDANALDGVDITQIASMTHGFGGINIIDAVPAKTEITLTVNVVPDDFGGNRFEGTVHNGGSEDLSSPWVWVFGVNSVGRPVVADDDLVSGTISPGGSTNYETRGGFPENVTMTAPFVTP